MTTPSKKTKSRPSSPSNDRLISGNLRTEKAFRAYLKEKFPTVNKLRKRKKPKQKANSKKNNKRNNKINTKRNHNARISMQAIHGFGAVPYQKQKKLKMEGGGDGEFDMQADATTSSSQGALDSSVSDQNSRNNMDDELKGQYGGADFIPPAGMDGGDARSLKGVADSITQGRASAVGDNDIPGKPCGDDVATGGRKRKRRKRKSIFKKKRTKKRRKSRKRRKSSRRTRGYGVKSSRTRKRLKKLRFSKMPPKYL